MAKVFNIRILIAAMIISAVFGFWKPATIREVARMTHDGPVISVAFSPDGTYVVSAGSYPDYTIRVWEAGTGQEVARMTHDKMDSIAISPNGRYVVSAGYDGTARVWEVATGQEVARVTQDGVVYAVAFSSDSKYVVSGGCDDAGYDLSACATGSARVWEATTGKEIAHMIHDRVVISAAFSPDGKYVVSSGRCDEEGPYSECIQTTALVREVATGNEVARMTHESELSSLAFSPDGKYVVSASGSPGTGDDGTVHVWEVATGKEVSRMTDLEVTSVAISPNGRYVVSRGDGIDRVWEVATGREVAHVTYDTWMGSSSVAFSPNSQYVVSGSYDSVVLVWEVATGHEVAHISHDTWVTSMAYNNARFWEAAIGYEIISDLNMAQRDAWVSSVAFSPDSQYVVSGSGDGTARVWKIDTVGQSRRSIPGIVIASIIVLAGAAILGIRLSRLTVSNRKDA